MDGDDDRERLLGLVPSDGKSISNPSLIRQLGWDSAHYYELRDSMVDDGLLVVGRGRGGTVKRVVAHVPEGPAASEPTDELRRVEEEDLYEPMRDVLSNDWVRDRRLGQFHVEVIARQGRRETGGRWSRPDLVVLAMTRFRFVPGSQFDVITFEVKCFDALDITVVYEALSHRRSATHANVLVYLPDEEAPHLQDALEDVARECERHGIGLIVAADASDYNAWDERVTAVRFEPDALKLDEFIATQLSLAGQQVVQRWK